MKYRLARIAHFVLLVVLLSYSVLPASPVSAQSTVWAEAKVAAINVRQGPGGAYPVIGSLAAGTRADVTGVEPAGGWLRIAFAAGANHQGWITGSTDYVTVHGALSDVAQVADAPTPVAPAAVPGVQTPPAGVPLSGPGTEGKLVFQTSTGGDLYIINANGTGLKRLTNGFDPALSPDGAKVAFGRWDTFPRGIWAINADGSDEHLVFGYDAGTTGVRAPVWSPAGDRIAFQFFPQRDTQKSLCIKLPVKGKLVEKCLSGPRHPWWKLVTIEPGGEDFRELLSHDFAYSPSWSPDGNRIVYASDRGISLTSEDGSVGNVQDAFNKWGITDYQGDRSPAWSPDGQRIVFQTKSHDHWEVVVINTDGTGRNQLTRSWPLADVAVNCVSPAWSPDGQWIVYLTDERGRWELYRMKADGSEKGPFLEDALKGITFEYNSVDERVASWGR
jgi:Tol biopolymer transport system component/uncharacterized protein YraI